MTIYVVTSGAYSEYCINAVFTKKEEAEKYCALHNGTVGKYTWDSYRVEEYEEGSIEVKGEIHLQYLFEIDEEDSTPRSHEIVCRMSPENRNYAKKDYWEHLRARVYLTKDDPELAFKIGKDMIAEYKAELEGIT